MFGFSPIFETAQFSATIAMITLPSKFERILLHMQWEDRASNINLENNCPDKMGRKLDSRKWRSLFNNFYQ